MSGARGRAGRLGFLIAILLLAFGLRLVRLGAGSLWYDETVSVTLAGESLPALVAHTAGDIHPPGYYLLLHAWLALAGRSEFAAAFFSLFFGVLLAALAYRLGTRLFGPAVGLLAALLVAVSPFNLWYSQEVRMYTLGAALGLGALLALLDLLRAAPGAGVRRRALAAYVACAALGLWVLYYFAFLLVALNLMAAAWWLAARRRPAGTRTSARPVPAPAAGPPWRAVLARDPRGWLGLVPAWLTAQAAVLLLYAPWLPVAWRQATRPPVPPWRSFTGLGDVLVQTWTALTLGQSASARAVWPLLVLTALLSGLGLLGNRKGGRMEGWKDGRLDRPNLPSFHSSGLPMLLAAYVLLPVLLIYLASFVTPLFHVRYAFTYSTPFYVLLAAGLVAVGRRWRVGMGLALAVLLVFSGVSLAAYHTDPRYAADDHRAAASFLTERWRPGDAILVDAGYAYTALLTYWHGAPIGWRGRLVGAGTVGAAAGRVDVFQAGTVGGDPGLGWGDPASDFYAMSWPDTAAALERLWAAYDRVWVYRIYDTVTDPRGDIRAWLAAHGTLFEDQVFSGESQLRVQGFLTGRDPLAAMGPAARHADALVDGSLVLLAAEAPATVAVGGAVDVAAVWDVRSPLPDDAILFAGLFDSGGRRWAQTDERPPGSLYPPVSWPAGARVRTALRIAVPPGTPPGRYRLEIGWYHFVEGQPVWLPFAGESGAASPGRDRLALAEVSVSAPADWSALPVPAVQYSAGVTLGGRRLLGFNAAALRARAGDALGLDLFWQGAGEATEGGTPVLRLADDGGRVVAETPAGAAGPPAAGQVVRDPISFRLPGGLVPGVYTLSAGVRLADGDWAPARRGLATLAGLYPLATVLVEGRPLALTPPAVQYVLEARLGNTARLVGYDLALDPECGAARGCKLALRLHWQALAAAPASLKIFVHLVEPGNPTAIIAQADVYLSPPAIAWVAGEYLSQPVTLELASGTPPGRYTLLAGFYDEATGARLPVVGATSARLNDALQLQDITLVP